MSFSHWRKAHALLGATAAIFARSARAHFVAGHAGGVRRRVGCHLVRAPTMPIPTPVFIVGMPRSGHQPDRADPGGASDGAWRGRTAGGAWSASCASPVRVLTRAIRSSVWQPSMQPALSAAADRFLAALHGLAPEATADHRQDAGQRAASGFPCRPCCQARGSSAARAIRAISACRSSSGASSATIPTRTILATSAGISGSTRSSCAIGRTRCRYR